jgi:nucleoside-diphosphate-sugar epimerase
MKVLIIGGTGLISTAIADQLVARGDDVTLFNRGETESRVRGRVRTIRGDRCDYAAFEDAMRTTTFDAVIDMVAYAQGDAESLLRAFSGRARHVVVCSTVCVYGGPMTRAVACDDEPHRPVTEYGRDKSKIESILLSRSGENGLFATALRPSFTTGEGTIMSGILFDDTLLDRLRRGLPVIVHDDGTVPWAIAHVSDVARGFVGALLNERAYGRAYHLTSDEHTTWNGVFAAMNEAAQGSAPLVHIPTDWLAAAAPRRSVAVNYIYRYPSVFDNTRAARDLGFRTTVPLVETFRRQIAWMESTGRVQRAEGDRFQDVLIDAYTSAEKPSVEGIDTNPWGNASSL